MATHLQALLDGFVEKRMAAGALALVYQGGKEAAYAQSGWRVLNQAPFHRDTLCHMYSTTKVVTGALILSLAERGLININAPVADYMPEYAHLRVVEGDEASGFHLVEAKRPLTVLHLLTMTSGIPYPGSGEGVLGQVSAAQNALNRRSAQDERAGRPWSTLDFARALAQCPLISHPGERWHYGLNCDILGGLAEKVTGRRLSEIMREAIFEPLGMTRTAFHPEQLDKGRLAVIYDDALHPWRDESEGVRMTDSPNFEAGGAGLISCADDYMRFGLALLNGGRLNGKRILSPESVRLMTQNHLTPAQRVGFNWPDEAGYGYGFTVRVMQDPSLSEYDERPGSFGWNGMAGTSLRVDPERELVVVFMIQRVPANHKNYLPQLMRAIHLDGIA